MNIVSVLLFILIISGSIYTLFSFFCVLAFFGRSEPEKSSTSSHAEFPPVSVLKPVKGLDPLCAENLSSFCFQHYPRYEVLFGFQDADDPAVPVARALAAAAPCEAGVVLKPGGSGANRKVLNLQSLAEKARYPMLALSDSDMVVDKTYLARIVEEYRGRSNTGIVTSLYKISQPVSIGSALESLSIALDFIPSVLVARRIEGITFGLGASILVSKEALGRIGGFGAIADYLADDYQLGFRLWSRGYENVLSRYVIENRVGSMTLGGHLRHQLRWARTHRVSRPLGFLGYGITHIFAFALLLFCIRPAATTAVSLVFVLALRYCLAAVIYQKVIRTKAWLPSLLLLPVKDTVSFFVWLWSFTGSKITWRGTSYRVKADGTMQRC